MLGLPTIFDPQPSGPVFVSPLPGAKYPRLQKEGARALR